MRAAIYEQFCGPISVQSVAYPKLPRSGDGVIVQVMATGVCRSDWHGWKGHDSDVVDHGLPFVPGHEFSGIVVAVDSNVRTISLGDAVAVPFILSCGCCQECDRDRPTVCEDQEQPGFTRWGSFAEYVAIPRADRNLKPIPKGVSFAEAAALGCRFTTAYRAVVQQGKWNSTLASTTTTYPRNYSNRQNKKKTMAVFGCGGVGLSCIMIARCFETSNTRIIVVDVSQQALEKAKQLGATDTICVSSQESDEVVRNKVLELTNGTGADLTLDAAGFRSTCENAVWCTRRGGTMVQVGLPIGESKQPVIPMGFVAGREIEIIGSHGFDAADLPDLLQLVASKRLNVKSLIEKEVTLEEGAQELMNMDKTSPTGMTVITRFRSSSSRL